MAAPNHASISPSRSNSAIFTQTKRPPAGGLSTSYSLILLFAFPAQQLTDRRSARRTRCRRLVVLDIGTGRFIANRTQAQSDFLLIRIHLDDLELELLARFQLQLCTVLVARFGVVAEALDSIRDFDECTEARKPQHLAVNYVTYAMGFKERLPYVGLQLLHAQREAPIIRLDREDDSLHLVALLQHLRR